MIHPLYASAPPTRQVTALDKLLRDELAAADTYEQAQRHLSEPTMLAQLEKNRKSHDARTAILAQLLREEGAIVPGGAGPWGAFTKVVEKLASVAGGDDAIVRVLSEAERHSTSLYQRELAHLEGSRAQLVHDLGLVEQQVTERRMAEIAA